MRNPFKRKPVDPIDERYRLAYPHSAKGRRDQYRREDAAFMRFAEDALQAASEGADLDFLWSCPDLARLAVEREGGMEA